MAAKLLTEAQIKALRGIRDHGWAGALFHGQAAMGGLEGSTMPSLLRSRLVVNGPQGYELTEAGHESLKGAGF